MIRIFPIETSDGISLSQSDADFCIAARGNGFVWKIGGWRHDRQGANRMAYSNDTSQVFESNGECIRIVIPVVVGSSPISHPTECINKTGA